MNQEQISTSGHEHEDLSEREHAEFEAAASERKAEQLEKRSPENKSDTEKASREALEQAHSIETERRSQDTTLEQIRQRDRAPGKRERTTAYDNIMDEVRDHLSPSGKTFSKFIHAPAVERTSEVVGTTVARPNAILAGSLSAFVIGLLVYTVARYYGYTLSGAEAIAIFAVGWILGVIFDFLRVMITGKKA